MNNNKYGFSTRSIRVGEEPDYNEGSTGDVVVPLHLSTTFVWKDPTKAVSEFEYIRTQNPTRKSYESKLASLENAAHAVAFSSGMAAETAVAMSLLRPGDHVVVFNDIYGGTRRLMDEVIPGITVTYADISNTDNLKAAIGQQTKMIWIESPTNPLLKICDIRAVSEIAHKNGAILVSDNTFLSPYFQNPLELGADIVVHSSTKYIGGHSDALGGVVVMNDEQLHQKIRDFQNNSGGVLSPFDSYLNIRGLKTLSVRMEQHQKNAFEVARFLSAHPKIDKVYYPGLEDHPGHSIIKGQARGYGGMVSFEVKGGIETTKKLLNSLKLFLIAESLGGVESLIEIPALMTHVSVDPEVRREAGIKDNLVRASVGIENIEDLIGDLRQGLERI